MEKSKNLSRRVIDFWNSGTRGKLTIGCSSLLALAGVCVFCFLCSATVGTFTPTPTPTRTPVPTDTVTVTNTPSDTPTSIVTATLLDRFSHVQEHLAACPGVIVTDLSQHGDLDLLSVFVQAEMQFAPCSALGIPMFSHLPLTFTIHLQPCAIDQNVQRGRRRHPPRAHRQAHFQALSTLAQCGVVRRFQTRAQQLQHRSAKALCLAQGQAQHRPQRQQTFDGCSRVCHLRPFGARPADHRLPIRQRLLADPYLYRPALDKTGVILGPVPHLVFYFLGLAMALCLRFARFLFSSHDLSLSSDHSFNKADVNCKVQNNLIVLILAQQQEN